MKKIITGLFLISLCACATTDTVDDKNDELKTCEEISAEMRSLEDKLGVSVGSDVVTDLGGIAADAASEHAIDQAWEKGEYGRADDLSTTKDLASNIVSVFASSKEKKRKATEIRYAQIQELHYQKCGVGKHVIDMQKKSLEMSEESLRNMQEMMKNMPQP